MRKSHIPLWTITDRNDYLGSCALREGEFNAVSAHSSSDWWIAA
jgi:hypothetical protein